MIVTIEDSFNLNQICESGQLFRYIHNDELYTFIHRNHILHISQKDVCIYEVSCTESEWDEVWVPYFDLNTSYRNVKLHILSKCKDPYLSKSIEFSNGIRILNQDIFEVIISFIISQNNNIPRIKSIIDKICRTYGEYIDGVYLFPSYERLSHLSINELKSLGLGYRARYILSFLRCYPDIDFDSLAQMSDRDLFNFFKSFTGIGDKVAACILLYGFHRTSFVPYDVWIKRIVNNRLGGNDVFKLLGDDAGIAQQYMYYYERSNHHKLTL